MDVVDNKEKLQVQRVRLLLETVAPPLTDMGRFTAGLAFDGGRERIAAALRWLLKASNAACTCIRVIGCQLCHDMLDELFSLCPTHYCLLRPPKCG